MRQPTPDRWKRIEAIFDDVLDLSTDERSRRLDVLCADEPEIRREVERLIRADALADGFLESRGSAPGGSPEVSAGTRFGPWRVLERISRGGMGEVYLAERADGEFEQRAALKLIRRELDSDEILHRFLTERQILARLTHPNIARLLDGGRGDDNRPWLAMELVSGEPITAYCRQTQATPAEVLRLFETVCDAVGHAHDAGVIHRDIKPSNILVSRDGHVKLLDFGIAKLLGVETVPDPLGVRRSRPMTPAYAAPEQREGRPTTAATDVYSLGAVLRELLTGHTVPRVEPIIARALREEPAERYASARALARDLRQARITRPGARVWRRLAYAIAAMAVVAVAVVTMTVARARRDTGQRAQPLRTAPIAVIPFAGAGPNGADEGADVAQMLAWNLDGAGDIRAVAHATTLQAWRQRGGGREPISEDSSLVIARAVGAGSFITGTLARLGTGLRASATLRSIDGHVIAQEQADAPAGQDLALVDSLSMRLLRAMWRSDAPVPIVRLAAITSGSVPAVKDFLRGERLYRLGDLRGASSAYQAALERDSSFALALFQLAVAEDWTRGPGEPPTALGRRLHEQLPRVLDRLPDRERALAQAYVLFQAGQPTARDSSTAFVVRYPDDARGWNLLGEALLHSDFRVPLDSLASVLDRGLTLDPSAVEPLFHRQDIAILRSRAETDSLLVVRNRPMSERFRYMSQMKTRFRWASTDSALSLLSSVQRSIVEPREASRVAAVDALYGLFTRRAFTPEPVDSPDIPLAMLDSAERAFVSDPAVLREVRTLRVRTLLELGRSREALARATRDKVPEPGPVALVSGMIPPSARETALANAGALAPNDRAVALLVLTEVESPASSPAGPIPVVGADTAGVAALIRAWRALRAGDSPRALSVFDSARSASHSRVPLALHLALFDYARALASQRSTRQWGLEWLEWYAVGFESTRLWPCCLRIPARVAIGEVLETGGDTAGAVRSYTHALRLLERADPEHEPRRDALRAAIRRLTRR